MKTLTAIALALSLLTNASAEEWWENTAETRAATAAITMKVMSQTTKEKYFSCLQHEQLPTTDCKALKKRFKQGPIIPIIPTINVRILKY